MSILQYYTIFKYEFLNLPSHASVGLMLAECHSVARLVLRLDGSAGQVTVPMVTTNMAAKGLQCQTKNTN